jgi:hypothetical protein
LSDLHHFVSLLLYALLEESMRSRSTGIGLWRFPRVGVVDTSNGSMAIPVMPFASQMYVSRSKTA